MNIILEDITDVEFRRLSTSLDMALFMLDFQNYLRRQVKWGNPPDDIETIYETWYEMMNSMGISLEDLLE